MYVKIKANFDYGSVMRNTYQIDFGGSQMELLFLGTGAGVPAKLRNVTALALKLLEERNAVWLFDCGEATQHQIIHTSLKPRKIEKIFITHLHGDHLFGLPGLLGSRSFQGGSEKLIVYGPRGIREFIEVTLQVSQTHLKYQLDIIEIDEGVIFEDEQFFVKALLLDHTVQSYGFRITEKDSPGSLDAARLGAEGIPPGPIYQRLKNGETIVLDDGRTVNGNDYLGPDQVGRVITILGDTRPCENAIKLAKDADLLVHEATFSAENEEMAYDYYHSTHCPSGNFPPVEAQARILCITHISSRYGKDQWLELAEEG